jgi:hypothetical protein
MALGKPLSSNPARSAAPDTIESWIGLAYPKEPLLFMRSTQTQAPSERKILAQGKRSAALGKWSNKSSKP